MHVVFITTYNSMFVIHRKVLIAVILIFLLQAAKG